MSAVEVEFMGGPAHGQVRAFPGEEPPATTVISTFGGFDVGPLEHIYDRQVSDLDDGPLWVYCYRLSAGVVGNQPKEQKP